ncbi:MAG: AP2 domain-containing protein [Oscillospiraceae bacterium]|nr:AP2 domain-containing protein [Oscillospiraceae bacterium]
MSNVEISYTCGFCEIAFTSTNPNRRFCSTSCAGKSTAKDITGNVYGKLTAIKRLDERNASHRLWLCRCECGNLTKVPINFLTTGHTKSCGCFKGKGQRKNHLYLFEGTNISRINKDTLFKCNTSGVRGVHQHESGKWMARIGFQNKRIYLGIFKTFEEAVAARREAEEKYFKPIIEKYNKKD